MNLLKNLGIDKVEISHITPLEAYKILKQNCILVDIREKNEVSDKKFNAPKIIYCPFSKFEENYINLPTDKQLIIACATGSRSKKAIMFLKEKGYTNLFNLSGGIFEWQRHALPVIK
jgi:rhodanese-related sulfurtransferase